MYQEPIITIVDDDADDREILRDAFIASNGNASYLLFENGNVLLHYLKANNDNKPSLIMLDLNMPGIDGRETLREIKSNREWQTIPVIVFTTSSSNRDKQQAYASGANCFVTKPDTFNQLVEITKSISQLWLIEQ